MRSLSPTLVRRRLRRAEAAWTRDVTARLPNAAELATLAVEPEIDAEELAAGSRPQRFFRDARGRRYLFKTAPAEHVAAEILAFELRALGRRPRLAVARRSLELADRGPTAGMLQPVIEHSGERLPLEASQWSPLQIELMLEEHPWEWVIGNLDTHVDQYVLVGPERLPFNIDWDHALWDLDASRPDRHDRRSAAVFPVRNLAYDDYVAGRLSLDFWGLALQARAVTRIPDSAIAGLFAAYAENRAAEGAPWAEADRARVTAAVLRRKQTCARAFDVFVEGLQHERADALRSGPSRRHPLRRLASASRDAWQRFAIRIGHDHIVRPVLKAQREVLDAWDRVRRRAP